MVKILVLGAQGMLGHKLILELSQGMEVYGTVRAMPAPGDRILSGITAERLDKVREAIVGIRPDVVINCIGIVKQLKAAKDAISSIWINSLFPHQLAEVCRENGARLIHFSTDCVFSGRKGNYSEQDPSDAEDLYGRSKLLGEVGVEGCLTIRSSIIGLELGSRKGLLEWYLSQRGKEVSGYVGAIYSGFTTLEMSRIVRKVILDHPSLSGVWNVASEAISKYELLRQIGRRFNLGVEVRRDSQFNCDRSLNGSAFTSATGYIPPKWEKMIDELFEDPEVQERMRTYV